jgi:hypothetical protein
MPEVASSLSDPLITCNRPARYWRIRATDVRVPTMRDLLDVNRRPRRSRVAPPGLMTRPDDSVYQGRRTFIPISLEII